MAEHKYQSIKEEDITLNELILKIRECNSYLWSKKFWIILSGIIGGILGFTYTYSQKIIYTASTSFVLEAGEKSGGLGAYAGLAAMAGIDLGSTGGGVFQGDNIIELYKSRSMNEKALLSEVSINGQNELLIHRYISIKGFRDKWKNKKELAEIDFKSYSDRENPIITRLKDSVLIDVIERINKENLVVKKPNKKLSIITVNVSSTDEYFSKFYNEKIVETVNKYYLQTKTKKLVENVTILQIQTDSVRAILNGALSHSIAVNDATPNLNPVKQILRVSGLKSQINAEANKAILSELIKNLELSKINLRKETPLLEIIDGPKFPLHMTIPNIKIYILLFTLIGVFLSSLLLLLKSIFK